MLPSLLRRTSASSSLARGATPATRGPGGGCGPSSLARGATLVLALLAASTLACGDDLGVSGIPLGADPRHFADQRFYCPPGEPACPPWYCAVDESGAVVDCDPSCAADRSTVFEAPFGYALCVPEWCTVEAEGEAPTCSERCAEDQTTRYDFLFDCR
ncbi:MAG TPA: hypothetical protein VN033_11360 [Vulgatibacter sp.]|nr:hypothetical protein [Vulgatibacter sp.]